MDPAVGESGATERPRWVLLINRIPREPSRHRVAVWRKLQDLGALYLQDGVAALPEDAVTREQLEWLQLRVQEAGGDPVGGTARYDSRGGGAGGGFPLLEGGGLRAIVAEADRIRRKTQMGARTLWEQLDKLERAFRAELRRDYFRSPLRTEAAAAVKAARQAVRVQGRGAEIRDAEEGR